MGWLRGAREFLSAEVEHRAPPKLARPFVVFWLVMIVLILGVELYAAFWRRGRGDTISEMVWATGLRLGKARAVYVGAIGLFLAWALVHLTTGRV